MSIILKNQAFIEEPYPNTAATGPYPAGRPEGTGRAAPRFVTWPHIRGACLYDGDRIIAVGRLNDIEEAAEHLNRNYLQDVDEVLRSRGLSG